MPAGLPRHLDRLIRARNQLTRTASVRGRLGTFQRVALRALKANVDEELDRFVRLQVLEGAAGVPDGTFSEKGKYGLEEVRKHPKLQQISPQWFEKSLLYKRALNAAEWTLQGRADLGVSADELLNALMGGVSKQGKPMKKVFVEAGKRLDKEIREGRENPHTVANLVSGWINKRAWRYIQTYLRQLHRRAPELQEDLDRVEVRPEVPLELRIDEDEPETAREQFARLVLDKDSDVRVPVLKFLQRVIDRKLRKATKPFAQAWLDLVKEGDRDVTNTEVLNRLGLENDSKNRNQSNCYRNLKKFLETAASEFRRSRELQEILESIEAGEVRTMLIQRRPAQRRASVLAEAVKVYADAALSGTDLRAEKRAFGERRLMWKAGQWLRIPKWERVMAAATPYGFGQFEADKVARWLRSFERFGSVEAQAAREVSPAVYIRSDNPNTIRRMNREASRGAAGVRESTIQTDGSLRLWWD